MGEHGPDLLLHSLSELRPSEAKRRFRRSIFDDYPIRGPLDQPACAYCGKWHEKLTLDHIVPKSKGGPHYAKWNLVPACQLHNGWKSDAPVFEWWRPQQFWRQDLEDALVAWVQAQSFVSAHTDTGSWEEWMERTGRVVPIHEEKSGPLAALFASVAGQSNAMKDEAEPLRSITPLVPDPSIITGSLVALSWRGSVPA